MKKVLVHIGAVVGVIAASILLWVMTISIAWKTGTWVGASTTIPTEAVIIAFFPTIAGTVVGLSFIIAGALKRKYVMVTAGVTALGMAGLLLLVTGWFLAMGSIT